MTDRHGPEGFEHEVAELRENQRHLLSALQLLFDLLEAYAPCWYTEEQRSVGCVRILLASRSAWRHTVYIRANELFPSTSS